MDIVEVFATSWIEIFIIFSPYATGTGRGLCDLVDWNVGKVLIDDVWSVEVFATSWIEMLCISIPMAQRQRRGLCDLVDWNKIETLWNAITERRGLCDLVDWNSSLIP